MGFVSLADAHSKEYPFGGRCQCNNPCALSVVGHDAPRSGVGLLSRASPVQTAVRNCTRDEGRSFEVGNQVLISSHRKPLSSKAMVVNVAEKSEQDFDRHD
jgi:hypothetical protein